MWNTPLFPIFAYDAYHYLRKPVEDSPTRKDRLAEPDQWGIARLVYVQSPIGITTAG